MLEMTAAPKAGQDVPVVSPTTFVPRMSSPMPSAGPMTNPSPIMAPIMPMPRARSLPVVMSAT